MSPVRTPPNEATARQIRAANPRSSTWLSANAGSGKTKVLTDRVARLLLDRVEPQNILCLTYTKAAAGEMQNRLFRTLGAWAMMPDPELQEALADLGIDPELANLPEARQLFARAIETPGGLKIQTIHSFCSSLLRRFPLEAQVSPQFSEMEDRQAELLRAEVLDELVSGPERPLFDALVAQFTGDQVAPLLRDILSHREAFLSPPDWDAIAASLGVAPGDTPEMLLGPLFHEAQTLLPDLVAALRTGGSMDNKSADRLTPLLGRPLSGIADFTVLAGVFLTGEKTKSPFSAKLGSLPTKAVQKTHPELIDDLNPVMALVQELRDPVLAAQTLAQTRTLYAFAQVFVPAVEAHKQARGVLDFDDLIRKAHELLSDPAVAQWVLYRLDGGIDHILVDEAQDTSPAQWAVIRLLTKEMTSGQGAGADRRRTLFVVGDKKQSIYSFQGADPEEFDHMQAYFDHALAPVSDGLEALELLHSFRSSAAILGAVDATFTGTAREGLGHHVTHRAFKQALPGRVDLWPVIEPEPVQEGPFDWTAPVDRTSPSDPKVVLAETIAARLRQMVGQETLPDQTRDGTQRRLIREGDILILVRNRSELFHQIIRALKAAGLAVAGADRLKLGGELAVKDLAALLSFLALPEDSLSLAAALRSPLFGWTERDLYHLAAGRSETYLWQRLRQSRDAHPQTMEILDDLLDLADFLRPYDLISRVLTRHDGRRKLLARLGTEAEDGIDALLAQAMSYEGSEVPSLTGFVGWMQTDDVTVKRQLDAASGQIRVMTVHGSKGLEAPIVILPDTARPRGSRDRGTLYPGAKGPLWKPRADQRAAPLAEIAQDQADQRAREERRLLYVAMTRAEKWLITCAAGDVGKTPEDSWYGLIRAGLETAGAAPLTSDPDTLRLEHLDWAGPTFVDQPLPATTAAETPSRAPVPRKDLPPAPLTPSGLGGAKVLFSSDGPETDMDSDLAKARGTALHLALEHLVTLPQDARATAADQLIPQDMADLRAVALGLLKNPDLAWVFAQGEAEVSISADLPQLGDQRLRGAIDRLHVHDDHVLIIDYKSNSLVPQTPQDIPEGILRQLGAYAAAMAQIYPDRRIETAVLWTHTAQYMAVPAVLTAAALERVSLA